MAQPIYAQKTPYFPLLISLLASPFSVSAESRSGWNCQQDKVSGEWSCLVEKAKPIPQKTKENPPTILAEPAIPLDTRQKTATSEPLNSPKPLRPKPSKPVQAVVIAQPKKAGWNCTSSERKGWDCTLHDPAITQANTKEPTKPLIAQEIAPTQKVTVASHSAKTVMDGWDCKADEETKGWDCNLTGLDPHGKIHLPRSLNLAESSPELLASYSEQQFQSILDLSPEDPWGSCSSTLGKPVIYRDEATRTARLESPAYIESDFSEALESDEIVTFSGNVDYKRADQTLHSDRLTHDQFANTISAQGNVVYHEEGMTFQSERSFMWLNSDQAKLHNSRFIFETIPARGSSLLTTLESKTLTRHRDITYSTCRPGNKDWELKANRLTLDQESGVGSAKNIWVHFKGVPLFYAPWITFPIDDRRKSGFLMPTFGSGDESGFDLATPYYWNITPNFDATITPRHLSRRGFLLGAELRYLTEQSEGSVALEYIAEDKQTEKSRGQINLSHESRFTQNLSSRLDLNLVSDDDYLDDFGNSLSLNTTSHLYNRAELLYQGKGWSLLSRLDGYQTIDSDILSADRPYRRLPQILFNTDSIKGPAGSQVNLQTELVLFDKGDDVSGKRLNIQPEISFPLRTAAGFITPKLALQSTQYWLDDQVAGKSDSINRTLPILSVDSGLFFERDLQFASQSWQQTLEPRLFYLFIPNKDQDEIPIFDTGEYDFNFNQLFRSNRFSGRDRVNDANQLTAALTTRFIESETGQERLRASIGQIFYFKDREVTLPGQATLTESSSDLVTEIEALLTKQWSLRTSYQWDTHQGDSKRASTSLRYQNGPDRLFNLGYQFRKDLLEQADVSLRWPIADSWHGIARWNYSLRDEIILDSFLGLEKENCCWRFKVVVRHSVDDIDSEPETAFFFQLELKGLTSFGEKLDQMLFKEIPGYQLPENR